MNDGRNISKNIFNERVLCKFTPDYVPADIVLRMQARRQIMKDTHNHARECNTGFQRKIIHKRNTKGSVKVSKEIINLRNSFINRNLRNKIMMKQSNQKLSDNSKQRQTCNSKKIRLEKYHVKSVNCGIENVNLDDSFNIFKNDTYISNYVCTEINDKDAVYNDFDTDDSTNISIDKFCNETDNNKVYLNNDTSLIVAPIRPVEDLQTLLINIAISSQPSSEDNNENHDITFESSVTDLKMISTTADNDFDLNFINIIPLKIKIDKRQRWLMTKYVNKWKLFVRDKRNHFAQIRKLSLDNFLEKLEKKKKTTNQCNKASVLVRDYNTYQHRYKVQKHVIALQKAKLEQQHRVIEELKYNKILEASNNSVDAMKEEVRKTYYEMDRKLKPKIKCLTNELNLHEIEEPSMILHCLKVPQFLQRMEKRAKERAEKHATIRERRNQMEEERIRLKKQEELIKAEMDTEEKLKRITELKEKRKREKIENIRKKQHAERIRALTVMADLHYERNLMQRCGLQPWHALIKIKNDNIHKAEAHHKLCLVKNVFCHWMWYTEDMIFDRNYKAQEFYRKKILTKIFNAMKENHHDYKIKKQVAEDYYDIYLLTLTFRKYKESVSIIKQEYETKLMNAQEYYNCNIKFKTFSLWRTLPALNALKREQDARKNKWRQKVLQVVPDYAPPDE